LIGSFLYIALQRLFELAVLRLCSERSKDFELVAVPHQLELLRRQVKRPQLRHAARIFLAAASRVLPRHRWKAFFITPETLLRWHRLLVGRRWTYSQRGLGRPALAPETKALILRLARENPRWDYQRIVGELLKLGVRISATTVRNLLRRHGFGPSPRRSGPSLVAVPGSPSREHPCRRLLHRGDGSAKGGCMYSSSSRSTLEWCLWAASRQIQAVPG
jgi:putative transposase